MALALLGAIVIGISLGLLGSGGSILTIPVLIFILHRPEKVAIAESLAIVGCMALIGSFPYMARTQIHWKTVFFFGLPGMLGAYLGACCSYYMSSTVQLTLFAFISFVVAGALFFSSQPVENPISQPYSKWILSVEGFMVGCLTGFIGVGGGFLIVPSLVLLSHLPMFFAIGTSLVIIAMNSFTGFIEQLGTLDALQLQVDWQVIGIVSSAGVLGSLSGSLIAKRISQILLKQVFGASFLFTGVYILLKQL